MTTETHPDEPLIKIEVDGVTVTGEFVFIQYNDITVRIHGHYDLKSGLHIPYFALGHSRYTTADGKPNETGTHRGRSILKELYDLAAFIRSHFDELRSRWASHEAELKDLRQGIVDVSAEIRQVKREMRQHVKAGGKQRDFQLRITALRKRQRDLEFEESDIKDQFFEESFPDIIGVDLEEQVIELLERGNGAADEPR